MGPSLLLDHVTKARERESPMGELFRRTRFGVSDFGLPFPLLYRVSSLNTGESVSSWEGAVLLAKAELVSPIPCLWNGASRNEGL